MYYVFRFRKNIITSVHFANESIHETNHNYKHIPWLYGTTTSFVLTIIKKKNKLIQVMIKSFYRGLLSK